jgi:purine-cytosine permease-like protein
MVRLSWWAPVLFIPLHAIGWRAWYVMGGSVAFTLHGVFGPLRVFDVYILLVGYCFVAVTYVGFRLLKWLEVVVEPPPSPQCAADIAQQKV